MSIYLAQTPCRAIINQIIGCFYSTKGIVMLDTKDKLLYRKLPALNLVQEMNELCKSFFQFTHANYFDYNRIYNDNTFLTLSTDGGWLEHFLRQKYILGSSLQQSGAHLWDGYYYSSAVYDARVNFNHAHGISIFYKTADYIEYIDIAAPQKNREITSIYLNNFDFVENFIRDFKEKSKNMCAKAEMKKIKMSNEMTHRSHDQNDQFLNKTISHREKQCLKLLLQGKTAKETAEILQLSPRTIEEYIHNLKRKLHCSRKRDLFNLFNHLSNNST